jgi:hypothetical protein
LSNSYVVTSVADTERLVSTQGWPNLNDWGHGLLAAEIIDAQAQYADLVMWTSTRATVQQGGQYGNAIFSCFTNTNGYTPVGRAIQLCGQTMRKMTCGWSPVSTDTTLISASAFMDAYTFGLQNTGNLGLIITNKSNTNYNINVFHGMTRPNSAWFTRQCIPAILNNTTTATVNFSGGNVFPTTFGLTTNVFSTAYSLSGLVMTTGQKITQAPILTCSIDELNTVSPYGNWDCRTIIPGKPTGLSGYRDMRLSTFETFVDPGTQIRSNVINCYFEQYSGGTSNVTTGGIGVASNANVFPRSNLAVFCDLYYDGNFNFGQGGKTGIGLFVGQEIAAGGNYKVNSSSARCVFKGNGASSMYLYVPANLTQLNGDLNTAAFANASYGVEFFYNDTFKAVGNAGAPAGNVNNFSTPLRKNAWNNIGIGIKVNTFLGNGFSNYDGECFMSINGVVRNMTGIRWLANVGNAYDNVSQFVMNSFFGGSWTAPANCNSFYSNVKYYNYDIINTLRQP